MKLALSLTLSLSLTAPVVLAPAHVDAAASKKSASQKQQYYTKADKAYIQHHSAILYKLRIQTEDLLKFFSEADKYNEEEFLKIVENKMDTWEKTIHQALKYRPQDIPAKFNKAHSLFVAAVDANIESFSPFENENEDPEVSIKKSEQKSKTFKQKAYAFDQEIKRLNKIYK
jgi:aspartate carbamoyltransferase catalytic subunit